MEIRPRSLLCIPLLLLLASCAPSERSIRAELAQANRCERAEDCVMIGSKCPFGCDIYVHADEAVRMRAMVEAYRSDCMYGCAQSYGVECVESACRPVLQQPREETDGNVGAACTRDDECQTPMSYLIRSNCPFGSKCVEGSCAVVCPQWTHAQDPAVSESLPTACTQDSDCDCGSYVAQDVNECRCIGNACFAVMKK